MNKMEAAVNIDAESIYIPDLLRRLWKWRLLILLGTILGGAASLALAYFVIPPRFQASALMYVNNSSISVGSTTVSLSDLTASQSLVDTYIVILKSRLTLNEVVERADLAYEYEEMCEMIDAKSVNATEVFQITVTCENPTEAEKIANTIVDVLPEKISAVVDGSSVRTVDFAVVPSRRHFPSYTIFTAAGLALGMLLSSFVFTVLDVTDDRIRSSDAMSEWFDLPVLAEVPDLLGMEKHGGYDGYYAYHSTEQGRREGKNRQGEQGLYGKSLSFSAAEAYKLLRANLLFALPNTHRCRILGITSPGKDEGKSTTAMNLAFMLAEADYRVLLMEADLRLPTISRSLGLKADPGLSNLLAGLCDSGDIIRDTGLREGVKVIPSGGLPPNPSELLGSGRMRETLEKFSGEYDFILLDLPPVNAVSDAVVASQLTDGLLMVVRRGFTERRSILDAMRQLGYAGAKVLGFVLTRADHPAKGYRKYKKYGQ